MLFSQLLLRHQEHCHALSAQVHRFAMIVSAEDLIGNVAYHEPQNAVFLRKKLFWKFDVAFQLEQQHGIILRQKGFSHFSQFLPGNEEGHFLSQQGVFQELWNNVFVVEIAFMLDFLKGAVNFFKLVPLGSVLNVLGISIFIDQGN